MRVHQLIELLGAFPPEMEVISEQHSDYKPTGEPTIVKAIPTKDFTWLRMWSPHDTSPDAQNAKNYVFIG